MPQWATFAGITGVVLVLLLVLSHLTQASITSGTDASDGDAHADPDPREEFGPRHPQSGPDGPASVDRSSPTARESPDAEERPHDGPEPHPHDGPEPHPHDGPEPQRDAPAGGSPREQPSSASPADRHSQADRTPADSRPPDGTLEYPSRPRGGRDHQVDPESLSTGMVLANVAASQGLFALVLIGAAIYTGIPADALGIDVSRSYLETGFLWGTAFGSVLYVANEVGAAAATRFGFDHDEGLRELLAPNSIQGWVVLLVGVLPIIAVFEELLFRAALIGAISTGFGVSVWLLAFGSSIAFALGHGMQGTVGIVVTGALGFVLAAGFILTGSFLVVVVAHYWINALEFVVHEGLGFEWASVLES